MPMSPDITYRPPESILSLASSTDVVCGVEFFHIYTDEEINASHDATAEYLIKAKQDWEFKSHSIVLIDNYNPAEHTLTPEMVFEHLNRKGSLPEFWAFEADMAANAKELLEGVTSAKLKRNYERYIENHDKYPCSLLTASWYLTRLGYLEYESVIKPLNEDIYMPPATLLNILPEDYREVEGRCFEIIKNSEYASALDVIQDVFIPVHGHIKTSL